ncbi:MAG: hypothetical protein Q8922_00395 [Bacteroidota bacterium]|nr:hypothetical protein [Bacteroidota bacterium]MDP4232492.1 hypothetical protein [Bacteroidota bacterium]MDP4241628.1 hypothetical protein [Bacteroidota bacterium]MDP4286372.1 hypothetical protein [Bacteroidota bacterium]
MRRSLLHILFLTLIPVVGVAGNGWNEPKLATKIFQDSTIFTLHLDPKQSHKAGSTFEVTIHVKPGAGWHVWSADMSSEGGLTPLKVTLPGDLSKYFELVSFHETGDVKVGYDSAFDVATRAHYGEYDVIAKVSVREAAPTPLPFFLYVNYQTCNEVVCEPPRWYQVPMTALGAKPIEFTFADADRSQPAKMGTAGGER